MKDKTIAQICSSDAWGGLEMSTVKMARLFHEAGYRSVVICKPDRPISKAVKDLGLTTLETPIGKYFSPASSFRISRWISQHNISTIYVHLLKDLWPLYPALIGHSQVRVNGFARMFIKGVDKKDFLHTQIYSRLNTLIALSEAQKKHLLECLPVANDRYNVIPNGVDIQRFQPRAKDQALRSEWGVAQDQKLIGFIGRLDIQKGCLEFVEAAANILRSHPSTRFVMVGAETAGESTFAEQIHNRIQVLGLTEAIHLTSFRKDVERVMNTIDIFAMPSFEENFGNVVLEALASGTPMVGTNSGGTPEMLDFGDCGGLFEPRSSSSLTEALLKILENPILEAQLATKARAKALREYDMKKVFQRIEALAQ